MENRFYSRLNQKKEEKLKRENLLYALLGVLLLLGAIFFGIPLMTKIALYLSSGKMPINNSQNTLATAPIIYPLPSATNSAQIIISGESINNSEVELYLNNNLITKSNSKNGFFSVDNFPLVEGVNQIEARAATQDGNFSPKSKTINILLKTTQPILEITEPQNNIIYTNASNKIIIKGITDPLTNLRVNNHLAIINNDGSFLYEYYLNEGDNIIRLIASDEAGNQTEKEIKINYSSY